MAQNIRVSNKEGGLRQIHGFGQPPENLLIRQGIAHRIGRLRLRPERHLEVGAHEIVELEKTCRGQDDIGVLRAIGHEKVDDNGK